MCVFLFAFAHETSGAARTRSSLRPLFFRGETICKARAQCVARMLECVNRDHPSTSSRRRPGPIAPGVGCEGRHPPHCRNENTRRMGPRLRGDDGGGRAGNPRSVQARCPNTTRPPGLIPSMPAKAQLESMLWKRSKGLPPGHDCCATATLGEDLTLITGSSCLRRFLATPLHEIIFRRTNRPPTRGSVGKSAGETGSRWTPRPISRGSCRAVT
jgi:hypothetical protein